MITAIKDKTRFFEISLLNAFFCLLIVFIHIASKHVSDIPRNSAEYLVIMIPQRLAMFAVNGFIFIGGLKLLLTKSDGLLYGRFLLNRLVCIVLPYIFWVCVYYAYFCFDNYFPFRITDLIRHVVTGKLVAHFYFIIVIIQYYLLAPVWIKLVKSVNPVLLTAFSLVLMIVFTQGLQELRGIFNSERGFPPPDRIFTTYLFYWITGCCAGMHYNRFKEILRESRRFISVVFIASMVFNAIIAVLHFGEKRSIDWIGNAYIFYTMSAILFFFMVSDCISEKKRVVGSRISVLVKMIDRTSFGIYLNHCLVIIVFDGIALQLGSTAGLIMSIIRLIVIYGVTIGINVLWRYALWQVKMKTVR